MRKSWALLLLGVTSLTISCGSGRRLQSISITQTMIGQQAQFVATGTFSSAPTTVSPLPVFWTGAPPAPRYSLSPQPMVVQCTVSGPSPDLIIAMAPANSSAPSTGSTSSTKMLTASARLVCP